MPASIVPYPFAFIPQAMSSALPPLGMRQVSIDYTIKKNSGNVNHVYNPCGYTPIAQAENHPSFGVYTKIQMALDIPNSILAEYGDTPKPGDFFTGPDGNTYNVIARQNASIFLCRVVGFCPKLSYDLQDTIAITPPVDSTDAYLSPLTSAGATADYNARIQFLASAVEDFQGIQFNRQFYHVFVAGLQRNLEIGTIVTATSGEYNGKVFRVIDNENIENLQELETLTCTIDPTL